MMTAEVKKPTGRLASRKNREMAANIASTVLLVLYQELVQGYYFMNPLGWLPQLFFLPVLPAASKICYSVPQLAGTVTDLRVWPAYIIGFFLMLVVSWAGGKLKPKREK